MYTLKVRILFLPGRSLRRIRAVLAVGPEEDKKLTAAPLLCQMADVHDKETRRYNMSHIKGKNTKVSISLLLSLTILLLCLSILLPRSYRVMLPSCHPLSILILYPLLSCYDPKAHHRAGKGGIVIVLSV